MSDKSEEELIDSPNEEDDVNTDKDRVRNCYKLYLT